MERVETDRRKNYGRIFIYCHMCRREENLVEGTYREISQRHSFDLAMKRRKRAEDRRSTMD